MASSQPIALPAHPRADPHESYSALGSYTNPNGGFNPASYTRHFLGSPLSLGMSSFGAVGYNPSSPDQADFTFDKLQSPLETDYPSPIMNSGNVFGADFGRDYYCCGVNLHDMHALLQHIEEVHVLLMDPLSFQPSFCTSQSYVNSPTIVQPSQVMQLPSVPPIVGSTTAEHHIGPFDPDDMELDMESTSSPPSSIGPTTPPDTPLCTPLSSYGSPMSWSHIQNPYPPAYSQFPLAASADATPKTISPVVEQSPVAAYETTVLRVPSAARRTNSLPHLAISAFQSHRPSLPVVPQPFNAYAGYSDYSSAMPGAVPSPSARITESTPGLGNVQATGMVSNAMNLQAAAEPGSPYANCVTPALVFSTPTDTPTASRVPSPTPAPTPAKREIPSSAQPTHRASTTLSRPASTLLLSKPFRCPKPNCNKSYKQANGLKYHLTHGSCNFAPPKDLEQVQALLASKRSARANAAAASSGTSSPVNGSPALASSSASSADVDAQQAEQDIGLELTESEIREIEREADRQLRPFACGIGDCQRRYKNMNGLRYHYQHSGEHGVLGLSMIANGTHACLSLTKSGGSALGSAASSRHASRQGSRERLRERASRVATPILQQQPQQQQQQIQSPVASSQVVLVQQQLPMEVPSQSPTLQYPQPASSYGILSLQQSPLFYQHKFSSQIQDVKTPMSAIGLYAGGDYAMVE